MSQAEKLDWRVRSQVRGLRVLSLSIPILLLGLFASSQVSRMESKVLWQSQDSKELIHKTIIKIPAVSRAQLPVQLQSRVSSLSSSKKMRAMIRYEIWDENKDLLSRRTIRTGETVRDQQANDLSLSSPVFLLESGRRYLFRIQLALPKTQKKQLKSWQTTILQDPEKPSNRWLKALEMLVYPALSITLLGLVMIFGPRLIR